MHRSGLLPFVALTSLVSAGCSGAATAGPRAGGSPTPPTAGEPAQGEGTGIETTEAEADRPTSDGGPLAVAEEERWAEADDLLRREVEGYRSLMNVIELAGGPVRRLLATFEYDPRATEDGEVRPVSREWCEHVAARVLVAEGGHVSIGEWVDGPFLCALDAGSFELLDFDGDGEPELWFDELRTGGWEYDFEAGGGYLRGPVEIVAAIYDPRTLEPELEIPIGHSPGEAEDPDGGYVGYCTWDTPEGGGAITIRCVTEQRADAAREGTRWVYAGEGRWRSEPLPLDADGEPLE